MVYMQRRDARQIEIDRSADIMIAIVSTVSCTLAIMVAVMLFCIELPFVTRYISEDDQDAELGEVRASDGVSARCLSRGYTSVGSVIYSRSRRIYPYFRVTMGLEHHALIARLVAHAPARVCCELTRYLFLASFVFGYRRYTAVPAHFRSELRSPSRAFCRIRAARSRLPLSMRRPPIEVDAEVQPVC